jgi:hypothetical protein
LHYLVGLRSCQVVGTKWNRVPRSLPARWRGFGSAFGILQCESSILAISAGSSGFSPHRRIFEDSRRCCHTDSSRVHHLHTPTRAGNRRDRAGDRHLASARSGFAPCVVGVGRLFRCRDDRECVFSPHGANRLRLFWTSLASSVVDVRIGFDHPGDTRV